MMMSIACRIVFLHLLCFGFLSAQEYDAVHVMENVQKKYSTINDASALFIQKTMLRFGKNEQTQSGIVKVKKGNKYRVETPDQQLIADGTTVWIVSPSKNQVLVDALKENSRIFSPDKFLHGLPDDFSPKEISRDSILLKIILEPKKMNAQTRQIRSLTAWVSSDTWVVKKIAYIDRSQNHISVSLSEIKFNSGLADTIFTFIPPQGMNIVDVRTLR